MSDALLWDDELENLANTAARVLGEDVVLETTRMRMIRRVAAANATTPIAWAIIREALKAELRRLIRPN